MKRISYFVVAVILAVTFSSCGSYKMVRKPGITKVKKIAIVSVQANRGIRNLSGKGNIMNLVSTVESLSEESNALANQTFGGRALVDYAIETFSEQLNNIDGWEVMPYEEVSQSEAFKSFHEKINANGANFIGKDIWNFLKKNHISPLGMAPMPSMPITHLKYRTYVTELTTGLGVDAVVFIELDIAYEDHSFGVGSFSAGTASANVGIGFWAYNKDNEEAAITKTAKKSHIREESEGSTGIVNGNIIWSEKVKAMCMDSIQKGSIAVQMQINEQK